MHPHRVSTVTPRTSAELVDRIDISWGVFRSAIATLGPTRIVDASSGWTYEGLLAHIAAWLSECPSRIAAIRSGRSDPIETTAAAMAVFNARAVAARRALRPEAVIDELDVAFGRARAAVASLTDAEIADGTLETGLLSIAAWGTYLHFDEHLSDLDTTNMPG